MTRLVPTLSPPATILRRLHLQFREAQMAGDHALGARYGVLIERFHGVYPEALCELERFIAAGPAPVRVIRGGRA